MATKCSGENKIQGHPCFGGDHRNNGRMHLAIAPRCNIKCGYCSRRHDCANESRPGVTSRLLTPQEAVDKVRGGMASKILGPIIKVVGVAGPGDPLANEETFETFRQVREEFPHLILCMSTNGLLLPEKIDLLAHIGLRSLTVTINAMDPAVGARIYSHINYDGRKMSGIDAARILIGNQLAGVRMAAERGITVKINSVLIPGINESEVPLIAEKVKEMGAAVMNVLPLIPQADFAHALPPTAEQLADVRKRSERIIGQFKHCRQCRADAIGIIGQDMQVAEVGCAG